ncbi:MULTISPECIES: SMR family transporter [Pseudomonas]|uniref:SMR family transporter n=1 Tax=Pseudomonas TaxID=286 RepID=UPI0004831FE5|nr:MULTISPECIES: SMR family transporter [Pseudomonas]KIZ49435.1 hypothetical protein UM91_16815 [Pseudomonas oryzihabitans]
MIAVPHLVLLAIILNVVAQIFLKFAGSKGGLLNLWLISAVLAYGVSFLLTAKIFAFNEISRVGPLMASTTFLLVFASGVVLFGEQISLQKIAGILAVIVGITLLSLPPLSNAS